MSTVPVTIHRTALREALAPLLDLLGVSFDNVHGAPGIQITYDHVTFARPATDEDVTGSRVKSVAVATDDEDSFLELSVIHTVRIVDRIVKDAS